MAFGTFDILHPGHLYYLKRAKALGDYLVVVIARDASVKAIKGRIPANSEKDRLELIEHLEFVDKAVLGDRAMRKWGVFKKYNPAIVALGYDQWASIPTLRKELDKLELSPRIVRIKSFKPHKHSSTRIRKHG